MNTCKHPNNVFFKGSKCNVKKRYNICLENKNIHELNDYIVDLEKNPGDYKEIRDIFSTGCWGNKTNKQYA